MGLLVIDKPAIDFNAMHATFFQKLLLTMIAAFAFACLIQFYKTFIIGADQAINGGYKSSHGLSHSK